MSEATHGIYVIENGEIIGRTDGEPLQMADFIDPEEIPEAPNSAAGLAGAPAVETAVSIVPLVTNGHTSVNEMDYRFVTPSGGIAPYKVDPTYI